MPTTTKENLMELTFDEIFGLKLLGSEVPTLDNPADGVFECIRPNGFVDIEYIRLSSAVTFPVGTIIAGDYIAERVAKMIAQRKGPAFDVVKPIGLMVHSKNPNTDAIVETLKLVFCKGIHVTLAPQAGWWLNTDYGIQPEDGKVFRLKGPDGKTVNLYLHEIVHPVHRPKYTGPTGEAVVATFTAFWAERGIEGYELQAFDHLWQANRAS